MGATMIPEGLSPSERQVWESLASGEPAVLGPSEATREYRTDWGPERTIRASFLARILLNPPNVTPDRPHRFILVGARITGKLDVGCGTLAPFLLQACSFEQMPNLSDVNASFVGFTQCFMPGLMMDRISCSGPAWLRETTFHGNLSAEDSVIDDVSLDGARVISDHSHNSPASASPGHLVCFCGAQITRDLSIDRANIDGVLGLNRATIGGSVNCRGLTVTAGNPAPYGVEAAQTSVGGSLRCAPDFRSNASLNLEGATIGGRFYIDEGRFGRSAETNGPPSLMMDHAEVKLGVSANRSNATGPLSFHHAKIACQLAMRGIQITTRAPLAIRADHIVVDGAILLDERAQIGGAVDMHGAFIECGLRLDSSRITANSNRHPSLDISGGEIRGSLSAQDSDFESGASLHTATVRGGVYLARARWCTGSFTSGVRASKSLLLGGLFAMKSQISGSLDMTYAEVGVEIDLRDSCIGAADRPSIDSHGLHVSGDFSAERLVAESCLDMSSAQFDGDVNLSDAVLKGSAAHVASRGEHPSGQLRARWRGASVQFSGATVHGGIALCGSRSSESLDFSGVTVSEALDLTGARLEGPTVSINLAGATVGSLIYHPVETPQGSAILHAARISTIADTPARWPRHTNLSGLHYETFSSDVSVDQRLEWLERASPSFSAQLYETLARSFRLAGQLRDAKAVEYVAAKRASAASGRIGRSWGFLQNLTIGYGYKPVRALLWATCAWLLGALWFASPLVVCRSGANSSQGLCAVDPSWQLPWDPWLYSLDLLIPLATLGIDTAWAPTGFSRVVVVLLNIIGWALLTTVAAAASRVLRRS